MRNSFIFLLPVAVTGCQTMLVYNGNIAAGDNKEAVAVCKVLETEYIKSGLKEHHHMPPPKSAYYWTSWFTSPTAVSTNCNGIAVAEWINNGTVFLSIVPQPGCSDYSRVFGEHMRGFITTNFPNLEWTLNAKSELDFDR
jgi:hypothetical protein